MSKFEIKSPLPGVFYRKPTPDSAPYKADGEAVALNDVIGTVEVMKSFHELTAEIAGTAIVYLVEDGDAVMAGQTIAEVTQ